MRKSTGLYPSLRVAGSGQRVVSMGGSVLLVTTATTVGLDRAMSAALEPWRHPLAVHDPGKVLTPRTVEPPPAERPGVKSLTHQHRKEPTDRPKTITNTRHDQARQTHERSRLVACQTRSYGRDDNFPTRR